MRWATKSRPITRGSKKAAPAIPVAGCLVRKTCRRLLRDALNEPIMVTENGGRHKITKREAIIKQLVNQSAIADWRAVKILLDLLREIEGQAEPTSDETAAFSTADEKVIAQLRVRFSQSEK